MYGLRMMYFVDYYNTTIERLVLFYWASTKRCSTFLDACFVHHALMQRWCGSVFIADMKLNYLKKPYIVNMGTFQMSMLLTFNNAESQTLSDLITATSLQEAEVVKQVQTLVDAKLLLTEVSHCCIGNDKIGQVAQLWRNADNDRASVLGWSQCGEYIYIKHAVFK